MRIKKTRIEFLVPKIFYEENVKPFVPPSNKWTNSFANLKYNTPKIYKYSARRLNDEIKAKFTGRADHISFRVKGPIDINLPPVDWRY